MADDPWMDESFITPKSFIQKPNTKESNKVLGEYVVSKGDSTYAGTKIKDDKELIAAVQNVQAILVDILTYLNKDTNGTKPNQFT